MLDKIKTIYKNCKIDKMKKSYNFYTITENGIVTDYVFYKKK